MAAGKRVLKFIKGTRDMKLVLGGDIKPLKGYTDADWGSDIATRRSTAAFIFSIGSGAIS